MSEVCRVADVIFRFRQGVGKWGSGGVGKWEGSKQKKLRRLSKELSK
ncbi:MAG: hypothetical protein F6K40_38535 [Okeania sp. SIO3I5]|nr:hypothetical protein [Okeania sp. SIO3I5]NEQ41769.1 hypothetical protein [Okeania sp. SIO3I5]